METMQHNSTMKKTLKLSDGQSIRETVEEAIARAVDSTPEGKERTKALKAVKWVLRSGSFFVGPINPATLQATLVAGRKNALVFDGRDNETLKQSYFASLFSVPFTAELL